MGKLLNTTPNGPWLLETPGGDHSYGTKQDVYLAIHDYWNRLGSSGDLCHISYQRRNRTAYSYGEGPIMRSSDWRS